jgi:hypothetical protein
MPLFVHLSQTMPTLRNFLPHTLAQAISRLLSPQHGQTIRRQIPWVLMMPLDPLERRLATHFFPCADLLQHLLDDVFVLDWFPVRRRPILLLPGLEPGGDAVDGVRGVGEDDGVEMMGGEVEGSKDGGEFGALVGLPGAGEWFGEVSVDAALVERILWRKRCASKPYRGSCGPKNTPTPAIAASCPFPKLLPSV